MSGVIRKKQAGEAWETVADAGGGGGAPSGPAGGVLDGTYPNPTIPGLATDPVTGAITNDLIVDDQTLLVHDSANVRRFQIGVAANSTNMELGDGGTNPVIFGLGAFDFFYDPNAGSPTLELGGNLSGGTVFIADRHDAPIIAVSGDGEIGFNSTTPVAQPTVAGALSAVVDPNAKAVLTSIIAALATAAGVGLVADGTT